MTKQEGVLKSGLKKKLMAKCPEWIISASSTRAMPDWTVTGNGHTTFWEFKHATPLFTTHLDQVLMCERLSMQGYCRYVLWADYGVQKQTLIVHPRRMADHKRGRKLEPEALFSGWDHSTLVHYIMLAHEYAEPMVEL